MSEEQTSSPDATRVPHCVGVIMDGNRRWAKARGLSSVEGHHAGYTKAMELVDWAREAGVRNVIIYAFSTENWNRAPEEVSYLMELIRTVFPKEVDALTKKNVRVKIVGDVNRFSKDIRNILLDMEKKTEKNGDYCLGLALSYGGRAELAHAFRELQKENLPTITETDIERHLWTAGMPDPDMVIRTSGEQRLSGFLPWQSVYSELFFTETLWPDFSKEEFFAMLSQYANRERRRGR